MPLHVRQADLPCIIPYKLEHTGQITSVFQIQGTDANHATCCRVRRMPHTIRPSPDRVRVRMIDHRSSVHRSLRHPCRLCFLVHGACLTTTSLDRPDIPPYVAFPFQGKSNCLEKAWIRLYAKAQDTVDACASGTNTVIFVKHTNGTTPGAKVGYHGQRTNYY